MTAREILQQRAEKEYEASRRYRPSIEVAPTPSPSAPAPASPPPLAKKNWWDNPPETLEEAMEILERRKHHIKLPTKEGAALRGLLEFVEEKFVEAQKTIRSLWPLAFFKPSYEQSLLLNAWVWGFDFPVCFSANRIGKTAALVVNAQLWIVPNDPSWEIFQEYTDHLGRKVQVLPRPPLKNMKIIQEFYKNNPAIEGDPYQTQFEGNNVEKFKFICNVANHPPSLFPFETAWPSAPITEDAEIWVGAPDNPYLDNIILPEWKLWLPKEMLTNFSKSEHTLEISNATSSNPYPCKIKVIGKSYESEDTKWSGDAVEGIVLTEGVEQRILNEIKQRLKEHAFASWDYTPYDARNAGPKTAIAYRVFKGDEELPLHAHVFTRFSVRNSPDHIIPKNKKADLIRMWEGTEQGIARLDGDFYSSSPMILSNLSKHHYLEWTKEELFERFPTARLYRGIDPGFDHPTCCAWGALTPGNVWFIYRFYSERQKTIDQRCEDIITLSNNARAETNFSRKHAHTNTQTLVRSFTEIHPNPNSEVFNATIADYKMFKADEVTGQNVALQYILAGLPVIESVHMGPEDRAQKTNQLLQMSKFAVHPLTNLPPGARVYFLINEPGVLKALNVMEQLFWDRYAQGPHRGEAKDKVPTLGDDELDALCNLTCAPFIWTSYQPKRRNESYSREEIATLQYQANQASPTTANVRSAYI